MKKIFLIVILAVGTLISCDDTEPAVFDGSQTLVYFPNNSANLDVVIDDTGTLDIQVNTTTLSDQDRTVTVEVVEGDATTVDFENVVIPSLSTTIPAGEFFGFLTIEGIDNTVETNPELLTLRIVDAGDATIDPATIEVSVRQICPIEEGLFTGPYLLEQVTPIHPANGVLSFNVQTVDLVQNGGSTERSFDAAWLEAAGFSTQQTIPLDLSCNNVLITSDEIDTGLLCTQGVPTITLGSAPQTGNYDPTDDSSFTVIIGEYLTDGDCGVPQPLVTEFNLTKQ
ncbi:hypothetical protein [Flavobacteriaceae bacterium 14752]|uniref:hypothetical protein n=1 Tax=Mesohalobacter salilacus TaxID=2491711 RepID=UPI000F62FB5F|nr:hypothetical protein EIG84_03195 [Flavobacteriaceae bacterium 14752]